MPRIASERWTRVDGAHAFVITFEDGVELLVTHGVMRPVVIGEASEAHRDVARWRADAVVRLGAWPEERT